MTTWTSDQVRAFLDHVGSDRLFAALQVAIGTGMRRGELLALRWRDVDLAAGRLSVVRTLIVVGYQVQESKPKSEKSRRSIELDPVTVAALRSWNTRQKEERVAWGPAYQGPANREDGLVFTREDGSAIHPDRFSTMFEDHVATSELPRIRLHDLRHTHATLGLAAGIHPKVMSERLGHSSIAITMDTYSHIRPAMDRDAADRIASLYA